MTGSVSFNQVVSAVMIFGLLACPISLATVIHVPGEAGTVQAGIDSAADGDTVLVAPGIYSGTGNEAIRFMGKGIVVKSESAGPEATILRTLDTVRTVIFDQAEDSNTVLDGFTISGGYETDFDWSNSYRGGIDVASSAPIIKDCIISGCYALDGGGLRILEGHPIVSGCTISNNRANRYGGGVFTVVSAAHISETRIENNIVWGGVDSVIASGGGVANLGGDLYISSCQIRQNRAGYIINYPSFKVGGGIFSLNGHLEIVNSTVSRNSATEGGGILLFYGTLVLDHDLIFNNVAQSRAGVVVVVEDNPADGGMSITHCTIACNYSGLVTADGVSLMRPLWFPLSKGDSSIMAGLSTADQHNYSDSGYLISDNLFAFNSAAAISLEVDGLNMDVRNNNVWYTVSGPNYVGLLADQTGSNGNISRDPLFCEVSDFGFWVDVSSPCIGGGSEGDTIGAYGIGCDRYAGGSPKLIRVILPDNARPFINQDSLVAGLALANPWDTLWLDYWHDFTPIKRLTVDKPLYIIGNGLNSGKTLGAKAEDRFSMGNITCLDLQAFCVVKNIRLESDGIFKYYSDTSAAVRFSHGPSIVYNSLASVMSLYEQVWDLPMVCMESSPLIRNCALDAIRYGFANASPSDIVATYNYWGGYILDGSDTPGRGFVLFEPYLTDLPTAVAADEQYNLPTTMALLQNHPNPFNLATTISYELPARAHASLIIYNLLGQTVKKLVDADRPAGVHTVVWDGTDNRGQVVSSGIYLYRLDIGSAALCRKMVLLK